MDLLKRRDPAIPIQSACGALGLPRALSQAERGEVLAVLHTDRFVDHPPREVYTSLLAEGRYLCSVRTMYRVLAAEGQVLRAP